ncbi:phage/plasmid primase, P4 family [Clostridium perfringens]|uniref:phage/plasmid primase, P4 family n=1 Tax=Clostridium perfringens TaxID=1502 RepID=UPI0039E94536
MKYLKENGRWCVWKYVDVGKDKLSKVPYNPITKQAISVSNVNHFLSYEKVKAFISTYDGLGVKVEHPLVAIDVDDCIKDGKLNNLAQKIISQFKDSYIEYSPSGKGLRLFCLVDDTFQYSTKTYKMKSKQLEVYVGGHTNRFVTVTGNIYQNGTIDYQHESLKWLLDTYLKREIKQTTLSSTNSFLSDTSVIQKASTAKNADKFNALWSGELSQCASHSEADLALCSILAFYCGGDTSQMDRLFRQSGLYRDKWDEIHGSDTYGNLTIEKACTSLSTVYQPIKIDTFDEKLNYLKTTFNYPLGSTYPWNDIGSAKLFADFYQDSLRYVPERKSWFIYQEGIWQKDTGNLVAMKSSMELANLIHLCAIDVIDEDKRKTFQKYAYKWQSHSYRTAVLKDAQVYHPVKVADFDKDSYILNCLNGTYHLKEKRFYAHQSSDLLTKKVNVHYDVNAKSQRWDDFIQEIMTSDKEKSHFLQKILGYGLSGDTRHECLFILHGVTTRNGKGTLCETILNVLGSYACVARSETIALKQNNSQGPSEDVARLAGVRFVNISEPKKGLVLNVAQVKTMTGNDTLNARFLHENSFDFKPQFKLYINTNYLPSVNDLTIFKSDRIWIIPFNKHFDEDIRDITLKQKFTNPKIKSAILNWLIEGYEALQVEGLCVPEVVKQATYQYEHDSDKIALFIEDCLEMGDFEEKTSDVYYRYKQWCQDNGQFPENMKNFKQSLSAKLSIVRKRPRAGGNKTTVLVGAQLVNEFL